MALLLNIETATPVCSVSLSKDGKIIDRRESFDDRSHASLLTVFINELLDSNHLQASQLDAVSISEGPGSYTGLRIGVSVAKGICYAAGKPLIAVNTLKAMALMAKEQHNNKGVVLCPQIDARRMEVYAALYDEQLNCIRPTQADIVDENTYLEFLNKQPVAFFGNGADKCRNLISHPNALFLEDVYPSASYTAVLAEALFQEKVFKDVAYFEPFYLKDFVATLPKRKIF
ncbi:MAG: tRNA (adenosine(37)-N6)-threonylcarbamoyltransferase complex dimerization subunit type 1 TsaB [Bacteroidetes bacterium HGW-Bacteroidetes-4]|jgi:tRNA threonylcarbamoyladenosine biosynthesis protein TsaB|nr:MAG: tRNA (adenosine(37)-N6)-threonylcarbamoyltransferase complex dimerization subunit type 1 TsaB [Bacteroidetes bacterium HGW-Bacteroidetes-4]